jgi:hypothetical protein
MDEAREPCGDDAEASAGPARRVWLFASAAAVIVLASSWWSHATAAPDRPTEPVAPWPRIAQARVIAMCAALTTSAAIAISEIDRMIATIGPGAVDADAGLDLVPLPSLTPFATGRSRRRWLRQVRMRIVTDS